MYDMTKEKKGVPSKIHKLTGKVTRILSLKAAGWSNKQIANHLVSNGIPCTPQTVCNIINSDIGKARLAVLMQKHSDKMLEAQVKVDKELIEALPKAASNLKEAVGGYVDGKPVDVKDQVNISKFILGIFGRSPIQNQNTRVVHEGSVGITTNELRKVKEISEFKKGDIKEAELVEEAG